MTRSMTKEEMVTEVKRIVTLARANDADGAHAGYQALFSNPGFVTLQPQDQRQALKLLVLAKRHGKQPASLVPAIRATLGPLTDLVSRYNDPEDYEMLGVSHVVLGNEASASAIFKEGLQLERERSAQSDLCGRLMTRLSAL